jgi:hypothetical protein
MYVIQSTSTSTQVTRISLLKTWADPRRLQKASVVINTLNFVLRPFTCTFNVRLGVRMLGHNSDKQNLRPGHQSCWSSHVSTLLNVTHFCLSKDSEKKRCHVQKWLPALGSCDKERKHIDISPVTTVVLLTMRCMLLFEKLAVAQLVKNKFSFMEHADSLPCSWQRTRGRSPEPRRLQPTTSQYPH